MKKLIPALTLPAAALIYLIFSGALAVSATVGTIVACVVGFGGLGAALYFAWTENHP